MFNYYTQGCKNIFVQGHEERERRRGGETDRGTNGQKDALRHCQLF